MIATEAVIADADVASEASGLRDEAHAKLEHATALGEWQMKNGSEDAAD
jgi:hypothetical protein